LAHVDQLRETTSLTVIHSLSLNLSASQYGFAVAHLGVFPDVVLVCLASTHRYRSDGG